MRYCILLALMACTPLVAALPLKLGILNPMTKDGQALYEGLAAGGALTYGGLRIGEQANSGQLKRQIPIPSASQAPSPSQTESATNKDLSIGSDVAAGVGVTAALAKAYGKLGEASKARKAAAVAAAGTSKWF